MEEQVYYCKTSAQNKENLKDDVAVKLKVCINRCWAIVDTGACSIWVNWTWISKIGGRIEENDKTVIEADGHEIEVAGSEALKLEQWGCRFTELVKATEILPSIVSIGRSFWNKAGARLDLKNNRGLFVHNVAKFRSEISCPQLRAGHERVAAVFKDHDVDSIFENKLHVSQLLEEVTMQNQ